jgi:hypothetical protein
MDQYQQRLNDYNTAKMATSFFITGPPPIESNIDKAYNELIEAYKNLSEEEKKRIGIPMWVHRH